MEYGRDDIKLQSGGSAGMLKRVHSRVSSVSMTMLSTLIDNRLSTVCLISRPEWYYFFSLTSTVLKHFIFYIIPIIYLACRRFNIHCSYVDDFRGNCQT